jgi:F0F1-type ATP synthase assembly protein I
MREIGKALGLMTQIGISMLVPIAICLFIGRGLDSLFGCEPICMIIFIVLGVGAGFRSVWRLTESFYKGKDTYIKSGRYISPEEYDAKYKDESGDL